MAKELIQKIEEKINRKIGNKVILVALFLVLLSVGLIIVLFVSSKDDKLQTVLQEENVEDFVIFGDRNQYVALNLHESDDYFTNDNPNELMVGRNHIATLYDSMEDKHQAYLVSFEIEKNMKKKVINIGSYIDKVAEHEKITEITAHMETIEGSDYLYLSTITDSGNVESNYVYNLDTDDFLSSDLPHSKFNEIDTVYFEYGNNSQISDAKIWQNLKKTGNLEKTLNQYDQEGTYGGYFNIITRIYSLTPNNKFYNINLFKEYPKVKSVFDSSAKNGYSGSFYIIARQGKKGDFRPAPKEPKKPKLSKKPMKPEKKSGIEIVPKSIFPYKTMDINDYLYIRDILTYQADLKSYKKKSKRAKERYQKEYNKYKKILKSYELYKTKEYDKQSQIYFSPEEHTDDILHWFAPVGEESLNVTLPKKSGGSVKVNSYQRYKEWYQ